MHKIYQFDWGTPQYAQSIVLRTEILRKPLGLKFEINDIVKEINSMHFGVFDISNNIIACLVLQPFGNTLKLRQMAVFEKMQGKGVGSKLIVEVEEFITLQGFSSIYLHSRESAIGFYKKLGYKIEGNIFEEVGIPHYKMEKNEIFFKKHIK